jgi:hypothetical protein
MNLEIAKKKAEDNKRRDEEIAKKLKERGEVEEPIIEEIKDSW